MNNIGVTLTHLGLQKEAIIKLNRSIELFENGAKEPEKEVYKDYHNRARLFRILGKEANMMEDIDKSLFYKKFYPNSMIELAKYYTQKGDYNKSLSLLNESVQHNPSNGLSLRSRSNFFYLFEQYDKALVDLKSIFEIPSARANQDMYELGKMNYFIGDKQNATTFYDIFLEKGGWNYEYGMANYQQGIVQFVDKSKGFGFLLGKTWFNEHDSIYFKLNDCKSDINNGDIVKFELHYNKSDNIVRTKASNVQIDFSIDDARVYKHNTYHGLLHVCNNSFKPVKDIKYVSIFYPFEIILPYSLIDGHIKNEDFFDKKYYFVELDISFSENSYPTVSRIEKIKKDNRYGAPHI